MKKRTKINLKPRAPKHKRRDHLPPQKRAVKENEMTGVFSGTSRGFGFVTPDEGGEDIFIPAGDTHGALEGDRVRILYKSRYERGFEGRVIEITEKCVKPVIGTLYTERVRGSRAKKYVCLFAPDSNKYPEAIPFAEPPPCKIGDKVACRIERGRYPYAVFLTSFGPAHSLEANCASVLAENDVMTDFEEKELAEAATVSALPLSAHGRVIQKGPILTIDGADAKDLDDAVSLVKTPTGYLLSVHIADVSEYVKPRTALDRVAMKRGTSVYYADRVIPMLPEALSNGACSLHPGTEKYTLTAHVTIDKNGAIRETRLEKGIIKTDVRGVYTEVNDLLAHGEESAHYEKYASVYHMLLTMRELYEILEKKAVARGYLELEAQEPYFVMNEAGLPVDIVCRERGVSERIIEHFMLTANEAVARLLSDKDIPCVFRVHDAPPEDKLTLLRARLALMGISTLPLSKKEPTALDFAAVLSEANALEKADAVSMSLLRAMSKAVYSDMRRPHFGLGITHYCHFTSPIRRLSDLITHRIIKAVLLDGEDKKKYASLALRASAAATETELRAQSTERAMNALYSAVWAADHIGEEFVASVSGVTSFGVFATLSNSAEGLIPMSELPLGAIVDEEAATVRFGKESYRLADRVRVVITDTEITKRRIRLALLSHAEEEK